MEPPEKKEVPWDQIDINEAPAGGERGPAMNEREGTGRFKGIPLVTMVLAAILILFVGAAVFLYVRVVALKSELKEIEGRMASLTGANEALKGEVSDLSRRLQALRQQLEAKAQDAAKQKAAAETKRTAAKKPLPAPKKADEGRR